jgi:hypothetical protein
MALQYFQQVGAQLAPQSVRIAWDLSYNQIADPPRQAVVILFDESDERAETRRQWRRLSPVG